MTTRSPRAFKLDPPEAAPAPPEAKSPTRKPQAIKDAAVVIPDEIDVFDTIDGGAFDERAAAPRRSPVVSIFFGALGILVSLALGLWADNLVRSLFARNEWLGWLALAAAIIAALALIIYVGRETLAILRLGNVEKLRSDAEAALESDDPKAARSVVDRLVSLFADRPETAAARKSLDSLRDDIVDGRDLVRLAEQELLAPMDRQATDLILAASKRVSMVTAVSPRALVDIIYVIYESGRLVRRIAELYGARPGTFGFLRLARSVLAHLAVTGSIAAGDTFVQQVLGHGLAARLSAKLGEGVINGMMTARIGLAAMDTARPLPFSAQKRPGIGEFLSALTSLASVGKSPPPQS